MTVTNFSVENIRGLEHAGTMRRRRRMLQSVRRTQAKGKKLFLEYSAVITVSLLRGRSAGSFPEQRLVIESIDLVVYKKLTGAISTPSTHFYLSITDILDSSYRWWTASDVHLPAAICRARKEGD